ncbi:DUF1156 domain-containing protein [Hymenobacter saemangeumensis]|uniref:DUF1156 domain-containing protein n=1 Tax=Hymenobacter saemangeumensis TaxID=1084522 RepID=A0ABP8IRX0_9BACT
MLVNFPKKLIEVALPLNDINKAAAYEKAIRQAHPSTLHLWWARRPLTAARSVLFAQLVNDPGSKTKREKLFDLMRELVEWENTNNEGVLRRARAEIRKSWEETCKLTGEDTNRMPPIHDLFAGGGAIPLEAQRLGLEARASDLNPVAVLINKSMIEIPPRFAGRNPVGPVPVGQRQMSTSARSWPGASGLAEDIQRYGLWMREEAQRRIGNYYPKARLPKELGGTEATVIAWLWARTVASPDPSRHGVHVPLVSSYWLSSVPGKLSWVEPVINGPTAWHFEVRSGTPTPEQLKSIQQGTKQGRGASFRCLLTGTAISPSYIKSEGERGALRTRLMAIATKAPRGRHYLAPSPEQEEAAALAQPDWRPTQPIPKNPRWFSPPDYGMPTYGDIFTSRQLVALNTFSSLISEVRARVQFDAAAWEVDTRPLEEGGSGAVAYGDAVAVYLSFVVSKLADLGNNLCRWTPVRQCPRQLFSRQAMPMVWDFAEANPFSASSGAWSVLVDGVYKAFDKSFAYLGEVLPGIVTQADASKLAATPVIFSTDPPYYDNIGYADLSDFFYIWLRRSLRDVAPRLFGGTLVPKEEELVATPYRHGSKKRAEAFFLTGMTEVMHRMAEASHPAYPVTIYYAFKQSDTTVKGTASTGWETFLEAVIRAGFQITATWPMRTENGSRMVGQGTNALASSVVLVCRPRPQDAPEASRREFLRELRSALPPALEEMIGGKPDQSPIPPADLPQATIGPGMAVFSRYAAVLEADGQHMSVHTALTIINKEKDAYFFDAEEDLDADSRFCLTWFEMYGWQAGPYGEAENVAKGRGTSVSGVASAGVLEAQRGKVRLLRPAEYAQPWAPETDLRLPVWEVLHYLVQAFQDGGNNAAGRLLARCRSLADPVRHLAYRLYTYCERNGRASDARLYNELASAWIDVETAADAPEHQPVEKQLKLFGN